MKDCLSRYNTFTSPVNSYANIRNPALLPENLKCSMKGVFAIAPIDVEISVQSGYAFNS